MVFQTLSRFISGDFFGFLDSDFSALLRAKSTKNSRRRILREKNKFSREIFELACLSSCYFAWSFAVVPWIYFSLEGLKGSKLKEKSKKQKSDSKNIGQYP